MSDVAEFSAATHNIGETVQHEKRRPQKSDERVPDRGEWLKAALVLTLLSPNELILSRGNP